MRGLRVPTRSIRGQAALHGSAKRPVSTPAVEVLDDAIVRNDLADHWSRILRLRNGQVDESRGRW